MTPMKVVRLGTVEFDGTTLRYDGWLVIGSGRCFASEHELRHEMRTAVFIELARIAGVYLEPKETDFVDFTCPLGLAAEREAQAEIDRIRAKATPRPW